jgi:hypothetical protein
MITITELFRKVVLTEEQKSQKELTGHLQHLGDYLFYGEKETATKKGLDVDPNRALRHLKSISHRFTTGKTKKGHQLTLKIDGGMSVAGGMDHEGNHFVGYKGIDGSEHENAFKSEEQIQEYAERNNKPHFVREMIPLLRHVKNMKLKPGDAFQGDIVHNAKTNEGHAQPNTIKYEVSPKHELVLAIHSQHRLNEITGKFEKQTNYADPKKFSGKNINSPDLAMDERVKLDLDKKTNTKVSSHIEAAENAMTPETVEFAKSILHGDTTHKKFFDFLQQYSNHEARTTGSRDVDRMRSHVDVYMNKSAQKNLKNADSVRKGLLDAIDRNEHHFHNLFTAHNHITQAANHILGGVEKAKGQFAIRVHKDSPYKRHEGIVSSDRDTKGRNAGDEIQAKLTVQGPTGFSKANKDNEAIRFGPKIENYSHLHDQLIQEDEGGGMMTASSGAISGMGYNLGGPAPDDVAVAPYAERKSKPLRRKLARKFLDSVNLNKKD